MSVPAAAGHYYIWYRVPGLHAEALRSIAALQDDVAARTGIRGRVLIRRDDPATWMEIYENVSLPAAFERELAAAVERHQVAAFAHEGRRHTEAFVAPA